MTTSSDNKNIQWQHKKTTREQREKINGHKSGVIWLTGLPGAGKSTLAIELESMLQKNGVQTFILDGDNVRHGLNSDLGFSAEDRAENIRRIAQVAKLFMESGTLVVTAFISPYKEDRDFARSILPEKTFIETYIKTSLEECEKRDPKGHYKKARSGEIKDFTGVSAPYETPEAPEIILDTEKAPVSESVLEMVNYLKANGFIST